MALEIFSFGQNDNKFNQKAPKVTFEKDRSYRFSFIAWPGIDSDEPLDMTVESPLFVGADRIFVDKVGFVRVPKGKAREYSRFAKDAQEVKTHIASLVVQWPVTRDGKPDPSRFKDEAQVLILPLSPDKYTAVRTASNFPLNQNDLTATCQDTKFQKVQFAATPTNLLRTIKDSSKQETVEIYKRLVAEARDIWQNTLPDYLGKELTIEELIHKTSGQAAPVAGVASAPSRSVGTSLVDPSSFDNAISDLI